MDERGPSSVAGETFERLAVSVELAPPGEASVEAVAGPPTTLTGSRSREGISRMSSMHEDRAKIRIAGRLCCTGRSSLAVRAPQRTSD